MNEVLDFDSVVIFAAAVLKTDAVPAEYDSLPEWVRQTAEELVATSVRCGPGCTLDAKP
ncbi:MAG: hypothetical protein WC935_00100 [Thermoleophilia bacterium]